MIKPHRTDILTRVLDGVIEYWTKNGLPPSIQELTKLLGYASKSNICVYLHELEELGYIKLTEGKRSSIVVVGSKWIPPDKNYTPYKTK